MNLRLGPGKVHAGAEGDGLGVENDRAEEAAEDEAEEEGGVDLRPPEAAAVVLEPRLSVPSEFTNRRGGREG